MNILKNVVNKLSQEEKKEVNLASEKIELGLIDDYNSLIDKANNARKSAATALSKLEKDWSNAVNILQEASLEGEKIEKAAKDLGINTPVDTKKVKAKLKQWQKVDSAIRGLSI